MKNRLNYSLLDFHIRAATFELEELLKHIRLMLGQIDAKDVRDEPRLSRELTEGVLQVALAHAYHHLNFAWRARNKSMEDADAHFDRNEKFPRPTGEYDLFDRFWPKSTIRKRKRKQISRRNSPQS